MTEAELSQYRAIKLEIEDLNFRIAQLQEQKSIMYTTKVKGSISVYPYIEAHYNVTGPDKDSERRRLLRINELERKRKDKLAELIEMEHMLHDYIFSIPESISRQIFSLRYIDGLTQDEIGRKLHLDRSVISRRISKYIN